MPLIFGGDDEAGDRRPVAVEEVRAGGGHDADRVEGGVDQLDQLGPLLHHPVGAGEAQVARAQMQHLDNVLRLEDLGLEAVERDGGAVAAPVEGQPDAGIGHQAHDALLHPALGQGQMDDGVAGGIGGGQAGSGPRGRSGPRPWRNGRFL